MRAQRALLRTCRQHTPPRRTVCSAIVRGRGVSDHALLASQRAQRVAHVWFAALACALVLLNPHRSGGFQLGLATMSDEALLTRQQRAVCWAAASVLLSAFPLSVGLGGVSGCTDSSFDSGLLPLSSVSSCLGGESGCGGVGGGWVPIPRACYRRPVCPPGAHARGGAVLQSSSSSTASDQVPASLLHRVWSGRFDFCPVSVIGLPPAAEHLPSQHRGVDLWRWFGHHHLC